MKDNELDDLFRSNADYLADQPPRDFDKDAFWQQMKTAIPPKNGRRKKPIVWGWAAAAVLLAGMFGSVWWIEPEEKEEVQQKVAQKAESTPAPTNSTQLRSQSWSVSPQTELTGPPLRHTEQIARIPQETVQAVSPQNPDTGVGRHKSRTREKPIQQLLTQPTASQNEPIIAVIKERSPPETAIEATNPLPETVVASAPVKPHYRVVHINEIRERKQQEAKARSHMAFRIGPPFGTRLTTQSEHEAPLSISIQN